VVDFHDAPMSGTLGIPPASNQPLTGRHARRSGQETTQDGSRVQQPDRYDQFDFVHRTGLRINPFDRSFHYTRDTGVNYMLLLQKGSV
jgi:hypothetical protein